MSQLELYLFGTPRFNHQGFALSGRKVMALAAYLAVTRQPHHRDALATLFWPDHDQSSARGNLRRELSRLNKLLGPAGLVIDRDSAGFEAENGLWVDVLQFERLLAESRRHNHPDHEACPTCLPLLAEAVALYTGEFMAGFTLPDCPEYDQWQFFQGEHLRQELATALERLAHHYSAGDQVEQAIFYAQRRVELDPLHEPAHRQLMQLYAGTGQSAAALRQYQEYARLLQEELNLPPSPETTQLYETIKAGPYSLAPQAVSQPKPPLSAPSLPAPATAFIGRRQELAEIDRLLRAEPDCRLLTLLGPGGAGKTRLALKAATEALDIFPDGVYFVPLASLGAADFLIPALAEALGLSFYGSAAPQTQLLSYLKDKTLLLVLDNFEQLLGSDSGTGLLSDLARAAPGVKLLVTSRGRLNLQEEWLFEVQGLRFPDPRPPAEDGWAWAEAYSAVQLFLQCARRARSDFSLSDEEGPAVIQICQLLGGLPLGLELAAAWVRLMSCREIAREIERSLDFLATSLRNVPERHRSLRAVFEYSWELLAPVERTVFQKLSVFQGSFSREAGEQVAGASLPLLPALVDQSLLRAVQAGRYEVHELLRQYAAEKLEQADGENEAGRERHARYYAAFLQQREADLTGERQVEALAEIAADLDNIRAAWQWAVSQRDLAVLGQSLTGLWTFCEVRGQFQAGKAAFEQAIAALEGLTGNGLRSMVLGQLLERQGWLVNRLGFFEESLALRRQSVALLRQAGETARSELAWAMAGLGQIIYFQAGYEPAKELMQEALALAQATGNQGTMAYVLHCLGQTAEFQGEYREAGPYFQESIRLFKGMGERRLRAFALNNWGRATYAMGAYAQARALIDEALALRRALGDRIGIAYSLLDLGKLARATGQYGQARSLIQESLRISEELEGEDLIAGCLNNLGLVACLQGESEQAESWLRQSLALYEDIGDQSRAPLALNNLGYLAYTQAAYPQAEAYLQESLALCRQRNRLAELSSALRYLGHVAAAQGHSSEARDYYHQTLQIVTRTGATPLILDVLAGWATLLLQTNPSQAAAYLSLSQTHPAAEHKTQQLARRLLANLPPPPQALTLEQALATVQS